MQTENVTVSWEYQGQVREARWHSVGQVPCPARYVAADDTMTADQAYKLACEGTALVWQGDFHNAKQLLQAIARRMDRRKPKKQAAPDMPLAFHQHRQAQAQRARILGMLLVPFDADGMIPLRRAPDLRAHCDQVFSRPDGAFVMSLRELQGIIGAYEWRRNGVDIPALAGKIYPFYGVFSPVRGEYLDLVAKAPLPSSSLAFDIGTGTGVLAAILARRGVQQVIATDQSTQALACATFNLAQLQLPQVQLCEADLFPEGQAPLVVCNPPWVPAKPSSAIEYAVYDPDCTMLRRFLAGLPAHLAPGGEGWLILSDIAEHLGLRTRAQLLDWIAEAGLQVARRIDTVPRHGKVRDADDPLHAARSKEVTSLWVLTHR